MHSIRLISLILLFLTCLSSRAQILNYDVVLPYNKQIKHSEILSSTEKTVFLTLESRSNIDTAGNFDKIFSNIILDSLGTVIFESDSIILSEYFDSSFIWISTPGITLDTDTTLFMIGKDSLFKMDLNFNIIQKKAHYVQIDTNLAIHTYFPKLYPTEDKGFVAFIPEFTNCFFCFPPYSYVSGSLMKFDQSGDTLFSLSVPGQFSFNPTLDSGFILASRKNDINTFQNDSMFFNKYSKSGILEWIDTVALSRSPLLYLNSFFENQSNQEYTFFLNNEYLYSIDYSGQINSLDSLNNPSIQIELLSNNRILSRTTETNATNPIPNLYCRTIIETYNSDLNVINQDTVDSEQSGFTSFGLMKTGVEEFLLFGSDVDSACGDAKSLRVRKYDYSAISGIKELNTIDEIVFYPNPFSNSLQIKIPNSISDDLELIITDLSGRIERTQIINHSVKNINLGELGSGMYLYSIRSNNYFQNGKIVKE